jgi:hypothetical protein
MRAVDSIELRTGCRNLMVLAQCLMALLSLAAILVAPMGWAGKALMLSLLACGWGRGLWAASHSDAEGRLRVFGDGLALWQAGDTEIQAELQGWGWISRWLSVVALHEVVSGRVRYCLVCARRNHDDDYRRLLVRMRLLTAQRAQGAGA